MEDSVYLSAMVYGYIRMKKRYVIWIWIIANNYLTIWIYMYNIQNNVFKMINNAHKILK